MSQSTIEIWLDGILRKLRQQPREVAAVAAIEILLFTGKLHGFMGWPEIARVEREVKIGGGRCDMVLTHADRSRTLIEVKADGHARDVVCGIGQLFMYEAGYSLPGLQLRKVLAVPGYGDPEVVRACAMAGVEFLPLGSLEDRLPRYEQILTNLRQSHA